MAAHLREKLRAIPRRFQFAPQHRWSNIASDSEPAAFRPLAAIERIFPGDTFAPAFHSIAMRGEQEDATAVGPSKTRLKEMDERHMNLAKCNGFNLHNSESGT